MLRGSDMVLQTIKDKIGIGIGEMTDDGLFSVHEAECLGSCGTAPMMSVNKDYHENLTPETINELIDALKAKG
jgi:NADH:ubiquinone oxidoreductase subunit E